MNIIYTIARFERLPNNFLVAFNITSENGDSVYTESYLSHDEIINKSSQEICQLAYEKIKNNIDDIKLKFERDAVSIVGYQFIPSE